MQLIEIKLSPEEVSSEDTIKSCAANHLGIQVATISDIKIVRKSLDARKKPISFLVKIEVALGGEKLDDDSKTFQFKKIDTRKTCHIIGFGPAGIFAAFQCLEMGIKPIVLERGKAVNERLKDIAYIHKNGSILPESNYCYGEGGAGTYSDGKLYTRSTKRGDVKKVLDVLIQHGAPDRISYEAHPHIGTNKLPSIIEKMRQTILEHGGEIHFNKKVVDFRIEKNKINTIHCADGQELPCQQIILATGHSARDIFTLLDKKNIRIEAKPFALGVRIEHTQELIDSIQYKEADRPKTLPPASYSLVTQAAGRGVFSFCMCPGGVIAPAGTADQEIVVNGWSSSARNGPFSNSGFVAEVRPENWQTFQKNGPLAALAFQESVEKNAFLKTKSLKAPAQRVEDFIQRKVSSTLPRTSYQPGIESHDLWAVLPSFISKSLQEGLVHFGHKMRGYRTNDAVLVGVESRTSSPVRIPRDKESFRHPEIENLLPCGEGAGYAGGIVSAALDGIACALRLVK